MLAFNKFTFKLENAGNGGSIFHEFYGRSLHKHIHPQHIMKQFLSFINLISKSKKLCDSLCELLKLKIHENWP